MNKRLLSILLAMILVFSIFTVVPANALDEPPTETKVSLSRKAGKLAADYSVVDSDVKAFYIIIASYSEENILSFIKSEKIEMGAKDFSTGSLEIDIPTGVTARAFLWDESSLVPLCSADTQSLLPFAAVLSAEFEGLTRIAIEADGSLDGLALKDVVIMSGDKRIPAESILSVEVVKSKAYISLDNRTFLALSAADCTISVGGQDYIEITQQGTAIEDVLSKINHPSNNGGDNSLWHNLSAYTAIKYTNGTNAVSSGAQNYSVNGEIKGCMVLIDFPDAKAEDNTGANNSNRVNGEVLKTAQNYYDFLVPQAAEYFETASYGNLSFSVDLVQNPNNTATGAFTLPKNLNPSSDGSWGGYTFDRGGDVDSYLNDTWPLIRSAFADLEDKYDVIYIVAPENAPGISYGPMNASGSVPNYQLGKSNFKAMVRIGQDTYTSWKYKSIVHETSHAIGSIDYYINAYSGPGGGQCDPYTGGVDYYSNVGTYDIMGTIAGHAPDYFAWMKWKFGWLDDDQVVALTSNGTTTTELTPVESSGGTKLIFVPGEKAGVVYCIEYRQRLGVDSTDSFDTPGILMYRFDASLPSLSGGLVVVNLTPDKSDQSLSRSLKDSVLGPHSGIYEYIDEAFGIRISVDPAASMEVSSESPYAVTVEKFTPEDRQPTLTDAEFVDMNTIQLKSDKDLRGIMNSNIILKNNSSAIPSSRIRINQVTSNTLRITLTSSIFTLEEALGQGDVTIATGPFSNYLTSNSLAVGSLRESTLKDVSLTDLKFTNMRTLTGVSNVNLTGISKSDIAITNNLLGDISESISDVSFNRSTMMLTVTLAGGLFTSSNQLSGTTLGIRAFSDYSPETTDLNKVKYDHNVSVFYTSSKLTVDTTKLDDLYVTAVEFVDGTPAAKSFGVGDALDFDDIRVKITYSDGSSVISYLSSNSISNGANTETAGASTAVFSFGDHSVSASYNVVKHPLAALPSGNTYYGFLNKENNVRVESYDEGSLGRLGQWWAYTPTYESSCSYYLTPADDDGKYYHISNYDGRYLYGSNSADTFLFSTTSPDTGSADYDFSLWQVMNVGNEKYVLINKGAGTYANRVINSPDSENGSILYSTTFDINSITAAQLFSIEKNIK